MLWVINIGETDYQEVFAIGVILEVENQEDLNCLYDSMQRQLKRDIISCTSECPKN